jgi:hypothetical protein
MTPLFVLQANEKKSQPEIVVAVYQHKSRSNHNLILKIKRKLCCSFLPPMKFDFDSIPEKWHTLFTKKWIDFLICTGRRGEFRKYCWRFNWKARGRRLRNPIKIWSHTLMTCCSTRFTKDTVTSSEIIGKKEDGKLFSKDFSVGAHKIVKWKAELSLMMAYFWSHVTLNLLKCELFWVFPIDWL